jgi:gluconate kinase
MTRRDHKPHIPLGMVQALAALYGGAPLTDDERAAFKQKLADRRAKDEQGREVQRRLELK